MVIYNASVIVEYMIDGDQSCLRHVPLHVKQDVNSIEI